MLLPTPHPVGLSDPMAGDDHVEPTTAYWQTLLSAPTDSSEQSTSLAPPYRYGYPAALPDGRHLMLPIRKLINRPGQAVASLIANQASFEVVRALSAHMTALVQPMRADVIVGLPTLGMAFAPVIAEALGHTRYVPLGYSRKFWYDDALSIAVQSLTTPTQEKRVYLDPNQWPLLAGRRVVIVDDAVSSGGTLAAVITLLQRLDVDIAGGVVAMRQGEQWRERIGPEWSAKIAGVFDSPHLVWRDHGWWPRG